MMTPRLREKLDRLAALVTAEWTGVKLRVTEAWDENNEHSGKSLHYEGRAAESRRPSRLTETSSAGRAGLAVDAGFDWVLFDTLRYARTRRPRNQPRSEPW